MGLRIRLVERALLHRLPNLSLYSLREHTVKRASLHNANEIARLDLRIGDFVFVEKGGEIIPKVTGVDLSKRDGDAVAVQYIDECPECATKLVRFEGEAAYYCPNQTRMSPADHGPHRTLHSTQGNGHRFAGRKNHRSAL